MSAPDAAPGRGIRVAFAGAGHWHFLVDARYLQHARDAEVEIVGLSDDDEAIARDRAATAGCSWTTDVTDLVERFRPDLVVAMPRPDRAAEHVRRLLDLGMPLIAEKPLGRRADEVWPLVGPAERGWVAVAFPLRGQPIWAKLEELRAAERLGTIGHLGVRQVNGPPGRYRGYGVPWMLDPAIAGGGPLRNIGIHLTDILARQLADAPQIVGATRTSRMHGEPIEDMVAAVLRDENGVVATLETGYSFAAPKPGDMDIRIAATGAYLIQRRTELLIFPADGPPSPETIQMNGRDLYHDFFFDALNRFRRGVPPIATVRDCARANDFIDAIYAAADP